MTHTKAISYDLRAKVFWTMVSISILLAGVYVYAVASTTAHTVARKHLEEEIVSLNLKHASLEFAYIAEKNKLDLALASDYGLKENSRPVYVSRSKPSSLSLNSPRR